MDIYRIGKDGESYPPQAAHAHHHKVHTIGWRVEAFIRSRSSRGLFRRTRTAPITHCNGLYHFHEKGR